VRQGEIARALDVAAEAMANAKTDVLRVYAAAVLGEALLAAGRFEEARNAADDSLEAGRRTGGGNVGDVLSYHVLGRALLGLGDLDAARAAVRDGARMLGERAESVRDPARRKSMLERPPDHRALVELARELDVLPPALQ
jgi:tetratricopeptide (TPR) repeat protein